jgi:hemerythrin HHE cation binding domain protein
MYGIELLVAEHEKILEFTGFLKGVCCGLLEGKEVDLPLMRECVAFGRNYADKHHHGKEEQILFRVMLEKLGPVAEKLVRNGMLVEHDLGRLHMNCLTEALDAYEKSPSTCAKLDIIIHAGGYAELLKRHIDKENAVVYTFAERALSDEDKEKINVETKEFEAEKDQAEKRDAFEVWLDAHKK